MMHFVDPSKMKEYRGGEEPAVIQNHNSVCKALQCIYYQFGKRSYG